MSDSVYAKPAAPRIILRPALATLVLHGLMVAMVTVSWPESERELVRVKPVPRVINATLVDVRELQPKAAPKPKPAAKPKPKAVVKPKPKPQAKPKPKPKPKPAVKKPAPQAAAKPKVEPRVEPKPEPRITEAELAALARADLSRALDEEERSATAANAGDQTASYAALIQQTVIRYWSRPPSARNGMEALLAIQLIPTGEVVSVSVIKSSGSTAFDRSAINAVEKAASFPELKNLPSREFEKTFRRFRLLFRPEDLRY